MGFEDLPDVLIPLPKSYKDFIKPILVKKPPRIGVPEVDGILATDFPSWEDYRTRVFEAMRRRYPLESTLLVALEELAELQQAILKYLRNDGFAEHNIEEEIADVRIMLDQLELSFDSRKIADFDYEKVQRTAKRYLVENMVPCKPIKQEYKEETK